MIIDKELLNYVEVVLLDRRDDATERLLRLQRMWAAAKELMINQSRMGGKPHFREDNPLVG